uniref:Uncharacterized protein n=1 Tax=Rhizophora mucronata TaxID=61149 RepID=A0A2P2K776_RHIMU
MDMHLFLQHRLVALPQTAEACVFCARSLMFAMLCLLEFIILHSTLGSQVVLFYLGDMDSWTTCLLHCQRDSSWAAVYVPSVLWDTQQQYGGLKQEE